MIICKHCLEAIEAHEGKQVHIPVEWDDDRQTDDGLICCEWCEEFIDIYDAIEI